jgi:hypothetical protein
MDLFGELLDAPMSLGRVGESAEDLVFGEGEAVLPLEALAQSPGAAASASALMSSNFALARALTTTTSRAL